MFTRRFRSRAAGVMAVSFAIVLTGGPATASSSGADSRVEEVTAALEDAIAALPEFVNTGSPAISSHSAKEFSLDTALTCIPVEDLFYCPLDAWREQPLVRTNDEGRSTSVHTSGDLTWNQYTSGLRALPVEEQVELLREDLEGAISSVGKVLADTAVLRGEALDAELIEGLPGAADYLADFSDSASVVPMIDPNFTHRLMTSTSAKKQEKPNYCGPASLAFMSYHDPKVKNDITHKQSDWAGFVKTDASGSSITYMTKVINDKLKGYSANVGDYAIAGISSWSEGTWQARFYTTTYVKKSPILLHPVLTKKNSSYIPSASWNTGGHFNVGVGFKTQSSGSHAWIFEPYAADGSISKFVWESMKNVRQQNLDNTGHRNIAY